MLEGVRYESCTIIPNGAEKWLMMYANHAKINKQPPAGTADGWRSESEAKSAELAKASPPTRLRLGPLESLWEAYLTIAQLAELQIENRAKLQRATDIEPMCCHSNESVNQWINTLNNNNNKSSQCEIPSIKYLSRGPWWNVSENCFIGKHFCSERENSWRKVFRRYCLWATTAGEKLSRALSENVQYSLYSPF